MVIIGRDERKKDRKIEREREGECEKMYNYPTVSCGVRARYIAGT